MMGDKQIADRTGMALKKWRAVQKILSHSTRTEGSQALCTDFFSKFIHVAPALQCNIDGVRQVVYTYAVGIQWCLEIARGLECLHTSSPVIVHRDLKLENILLAGAPRITSN